MNKQTWQKVRSVFLVVFLVLAVSACGKKVVSIDNDGNEVYEVSDSDISDGRASSDNELALGIRTVRFPLDSFSLTARNKRIMRANAKILKSNSSINVQIEGHCDERGGIQYNLALGEKRANALKSYLTSRGVRSSRVQVVSLGKEQPIAFGSNEDAWSKNRRGNFVVTSR